jgi:cholesterol transport system auxiliary component
MSRSIFSCRTATTLCTTLAACALVAACAGSPVVMSDIRYDLGPTPTQTDVANVASTLPPLRVLAVIAPSQLDHDDILYRLSTDPQRTASYAHSRWAMSPARLLTSRVRESLGTHTMVLAASDAAQAPMVRIELDQFEQVFDSASVSAGELTARVTLIEDGRASAQHVFVARAPAPSPDAAGGVRALAAASDDFVGQLVAWLGTQQFAGKQ